MEETDNHPVVSMERLKKGHSASSQSCLSTASTLNISLEPTYVNVSRDSKIWRLERDEGSGESGDEGSSSHCLEFAPIKGEPGVELKPPALPKDIPPCSQHWDWKLSQLLDYGPGPTATDLINRSFEKFKKLTFEDFVETAKAAKGTPSDAIRFFLWTYELLEWKVYSAFIKHPDHLDLLIQLEGDLEKSAADPFVLRAVKRARQCVILKRPLRDEEGKQEEQPIDLFIKPLRRCLAQTEPNVRDTQLRVLKIRFYQHYHCGEVCWTEFDTNTKFLEQLQSLRPSTLAKALSWKDRAFLGEYITDAFTSHEIGHTARSRINTRWNLLSREVEECMTEGTQVTRKLDHLAEELFRLHNDYSLTAVIQGIMASGVDTPALRKFGILVKSDNNYQAYRQHMDSCQRNGRLYFPFPALANYRRGDSTLAMVVISGYRAYKPEAEQDCLRFRFFLSCCGCFGL